MISSAAVLRELKEENEDFEWYPTTDEIIRSLVKDVERVLDDDEIRIRIDSVLDIGAGNGKVLRAFPDKDRYAIEKAQKLCALLAPMAFIVGTDFWQQSLMTKKIDLTFCNPPYSEYEAWATKIIRESSSKVVYLVLPKRWNKSVDIEAALKYRDGEVKIVGSFDFEDAEDRKARAKVDLIRILLSQDSDDAFDRFFDEEFSGLKARFDQAEKEEAKGPDDSKFKQLVMAENYVEAIVRMYDEEMLKIRHHYDCIATLDADLLREFNVRPADILKCLKERLCALKQVYWRELFDRMRPITDRLTTKKRRTLLDTLNDNGHVDFTVQNIQAVVIWVLAHASKYIDEQVMEVFDEMISKANVRNYKSNQRVYEFNRWRYEQEHPTHIALDYRLVLEHSGGISHARSWEKGLEERARDFLRDLCAVANNLHFHVDTSDTRFVLPSAWTAGSREEFYFTRDGKRDILFDVRAFLNGNMHIRLNQQFALALNVENGRLRGWIHTPSEAAQELENMEAVQYFGTQITLKMSSLPQLTGCTETQEGTDR